MAVYVHVHVCKIRYIWVKILGKTHEEDADNTRET